MYKIIGADQKQYGPISGEQIRQWISEGRVNGQTVACAEGSEDWKPIADFPEFGFTAAPVSAATPPAFSEPLTREQILARDYSLDLMSCFTRGWALLKDNFATMVVSFLLFIVLAFAASVAMQIIFAAVGVNRLPLAARQYLGPIYVIFQTLVIGPAYGGLFYVYLSLMRGQNAAVGELFEGFKSFQDLFLGKLLPSLASALCFLPYTIVYVSKMTPAIESMKGTKPADFQAVVHMMVNTIFQPMLDAMPVYLICLIPVTYLFVNWQFTMPLIVDKQMGFWTAMCTSWRMVHKHWFHLLGLAILIGLLNLAGVLACFVGWIVTVPLGLAALCYAYEDIFGRQKP